MKKSSSPTGIRIHDVVLACPLFPCADQVRPSVFLLGFGHPSDGLQADASIDELATLAGRQGKDRIEVKLIDFRLLLYEPGNTQEQFFQGCHVGGANNDRRSLLMKCFRRFV